MADVGPVRDVWGEQVKQRFKECNKNISYLVNVFDFVYKVTPRRMSYNVTHCRTLFRFINSINQTNVI